MPSDVKLEDDDACLVIRSNGEREVYIPHAGDDSLVYGNSPTGLICKAAIALEDVEIATLLQKKFEEEGNAEVAVFTKDKN